MTKLDNGIESFAGPHARRDDPGVRELRDIQRTLRKVSHAEATCAHISFEMHQ